MLLFFAGRYHFAVVTRGVVGWDVEGIHAASRLYI